MLLYTSLGGNEIDQFNLVGQNLNQTISNIKHGTNWTIPRKTITSSIRKIFEQIV